MDIQLWKQTKKEKKLTNQAISDLSGVPKRTVEDIFSGATKFPRSDTVDAIEKALGLNQEQQGYSSNPKVNELVDLLMSLDENKLVDAISVIKIMAKK